MNIFQKLLGSSEEKGFKLPIVGTTSSMINGLRHFLPTSKTDATYMKEYKNWVFTCVNARSEEMASIDIILKNKKTGEIIDSHEILTLLHDVNPNSTMYELFFATQAFKDLCGNAYWYLARDKDGKGDIKQIYLISPEKMSIVFDKANPLNIIGYMYGSGTDAVPFGKEEILHFKNFNPWGNYPNPHKGVGIVESALWAIETDNESRNWNYSFFKNNAKPDGIISTEATLSDSAFARLKEQWQQTYGGASNHGKTALLDGGLKWQDISKTQSDMDFIAQRTFSRDEILSIFRVPKTVVGITDDVNRANAEASDYVFAKRTVKPLMTSFVTTLNEYLLQESYPDVELSFKDPVPVDRVAKVQEFSLGINKWLTRNDIRKEEGLDLSENGDIFYGGAFDVPIDTVPVAKQAPKSVVKEKSNGDVLDKKVDDFIASLPKKTIYRQLSTVQKTIYKEIYLKRFDDNEKKLIKDVKSYFRTQEAEVLENLKSEYSDLKAINFKLKGVDDVLFNEANAIKTGISLITPHIRNFLKDGAELADSVTNHDSNLNNTDTAKFITERSKFFAVTINDTTREALLKTIKDSVDNNESFDEIKAKIATIYNEAETYRTERIARTEVSTALNQGSIEAYKQAGVESLEWVAVEDDRTSEECMLNDGEIRKIGESYPAGESQPPQHINCRCTTVAVFND